VFKREKGKIDVQRAKGKLGKRSKINQRNHI
jgi:hypothetical protein